MGEMHPDLMGAPGFELYADRGMRCKALDYAVVRDRRFAITLHAGWRGLLGGVLEATVRAMSADPANLLAWLGPAISQAAFEVGGEVRQQFLAHDPAADDCFAENERGRWQADLYGLARMRLSGLGVGQVSGGEYCTFSEPERFFSYRRDGACGRMASFVFRR